MNCFADDDSLTPYERERAARIARNRDVRRYILFSRLHIIILYCFILI